MFIIKSKGKVSRSFGSREEFVTVVCTLAFWGRWSFCVPSVSGSAWRLMAQSVKSDHHSLPFMVQSIRSLECLMFARTTQCLCLKPCLFFFSFSFPLLLSVSRLAKEELSYINEAKEQEEKVERLKAEGGDEFLIKKQVFSFYWFSGFNTSHLLVDYLSV